MAMAARPQQSFRPEPVDQPYRPDPLDLFGDPPLARDILPDLVAYVEDRRARNLDTYIVCTGREGWGKSSLGLTAALAIEPDLDPETIVFDKQDYYEIYDPRAYDQTYVFDEAANLLFNRSWNSRHQKDLIKEVIANRQSRNVTFLHLPQFKILDKYAREGRIDLWFACTGQGIAMIRELKYNAYTEEAHYPIRVDEHRWEPLEVTHPAFAEVYYQRKDDKRAQEFDRRRRKTMKKDQEDGLDEAVSATLGKAY